MKLKIEELKKIPLRIINELQEVKTLEERNKIKLMEYRKLEKEIEEHYKDIERLIENWNEAYVMIGEKEELK